MKSLGERLREDAVQHAVVSWAGWLSAELCGFAETEQHLLHNQLHLGVSPGPCLPGLATAFAFISLVLSRAGSSGPTAHSLGLCVSSEGWEVGAEGCQGEESLAGKAGSLQVLGGAKQR